MRTCLFCEQELDRDNPSPFCDEVCRLRAAETRGYHYTHLQVVPVTGAAQWGKFPRKRSPTFTRH